MKRHNRRMLEIIREAPWGDSAEKEIQ